jgi:hypothetical protein
MQLKQALSPAKKFGLVGSFIAVTVFAGCGGGGIQSNSGGLTVVGAQMGGARQGVALNLTTAVSTMSGSGSAGAADNITGTLATFTSPYGIATDGANLYVADSGNNIIRKVVIASGVVTTLAGSGAVGSADGTGSAASFSYPQGITTDGINLYVSDTHNSTIRQVVIATGAVSTLAGSPSAPLGAVDGTGAGATFYYPSGITTDGSNLYVADTWTNTIRKIVIATRVVSTIAGSATAPPGAVDGTGSAASFNEPRGVTTDGTGNLYVADKGNNTIRKIEIATGAVSTFAGSGTPSAVDGTGTASSFIYPMGITTDGTSLFVADSGNNKIRRIAVASMVVSTLAGSGAIGALDNTSGVQATFTQPVGITTDGINLFVADIGNNKIRKIQ